MKIWKNLRNPLPQRVPAYLLTGYRVVGRLALVDNEQRDEREEQRPQAHAPERAESPREDRAREPEHYDDSPDSEPPLRSESNPAEPASARAGSDTPGGPGQRSEGGGGRRPRRYPRDRRGGRGRGRERGRDPRGEARPREREPRRPAYQPTTIGRGDEERGTTPAEPQPQDEQTIRRVGLLRDTREQVERIREVLQQVLEDLEDVSVQLSKAEHEKDIAEEEIDHLREQLRRLHR